MWWYGFWFPRWFKPDYTRLPFLEFAPIVFSIDLEFQSKSRFNREPVEIEIVEIDVEAAILKKTVDNEE